jgi:hypothetical protein
VYALADEAPGRVWLDSFALNAANESVAATGPRFLSSPAERRHYLALLAEWRAAKPITRRGSTREELTARLRALALHLDRRQVAANQRERSALHPAIRLTSTVADPIEEECIPEEQLRAEAEAEWRERLRQEEVDQRRARRQRQAERERQAQAVAA